MDLIKNRINQLDSHKSFVGGYPNIPLNMSLPKCSLCDNDMTFFFQVAFPENYFWGGYSLALFACTSCAQRGHFIPIWPEPMTTVIPEGFLNIDRYQTNFRILTFETSKASLRSDYVPRVKFFSWMFKNASNAVEYKTKLYGDLPKRIAEQYLIPREYESNELKLVLSIAPNQTYDIYETAPRQKVFQYAPHLPDTRAEENYLLFLANGLYFFATDIKEADKIFIYAIRKE